MTFIPEIRTDKNDSSNFIFRMTLIWVIFIFYIIFLISVISVIDINNVVSVQPYIIINYMGIEKSS